jgi:hypothetical protein
MIDPGSHALSQFTNQLRPVDRPFLDFAKTSSAQVTSLATGILDVSRLAGALAVCALLGSALISGAGGKSQK